MEDLKTPAAWHEAPGMSWRCQSRNWSATQAVCLFVFTICSLAAVQRVHLAAASQSDLIGGGHSQPLQNSEANPKEQLERAPNGRHSRSASAVEVDATEEENFHPAAQRTVSVQRARSHSSLSDAEINQPKLQIVRLFGPDSVQNGTNVTIDCMFKYDKKLDQRLAIKWFFNDELEPIYQWIPELNKRVYSDRYERFIDKQYQVSEDVDFMLAAYKKLLTREDEPHSGGGGGGGSESTGGESNAIMTRQGRHKQDDEPPGGDQQTNLVANRRLLANRLSRLAKLGAEHSKHLLASLRSALAMDRDDDQTNQFRALRLIRPTVEMDGRYTCSVSSLDSEDLRSTRLVVYEPPREFAFNVSKAPSGMYNLTCHAGPTYPQPSLALYRYRAGQLEPAAVAVASAHARESDRYAPAPPRLRLAAATLKQESLANTRTQLKISSPVAAAAGGKELTREIRRDELRSPPSETVIDLDVETTNQLARSPGQASDSTTPPVPLPYEISAWALVDEFSLSANLVTQFECVLKLDGANYEQRQTLALEKGWHVNSSGALVARTALVGLMSVLASLLCLTVALASAILVFKLLREHANKSQRVHQRQVNMRAKGDDGDKQGGSSGVSSSSPSNSSRTTTTSGTLARGPNTAALNETGIISERSRNESGPLSPMDRIAPSTMQSRASNYQQRRWQPAEP